MIEIKIENYGEMVELLAKSGEDILATLTPEKVHTLHMAVGIAGEAVEVLNAFKNDDFENLCEELGDIEFYLEGIKKYLDKEYLAKLADHTRLFNSKDMVADFVVAAGDVLDTTKKIVIYNDNSKYELLCEFVAKFESMLNMVYASCFINRVDICLKNMDKLLRKRYPNGYTDEAAKARADKEGEE